MRKLIKFSIEHPVPVLMTVAAGVLLGIFSALYIPLDFLPAVPARTLLITAEYEGIAAAQMRQLVTVPLEDALASLKGLKTVSSVSRDGLSLITAELHWNTDIEAALVECRELIDMQYEKLPTLCKKPAASRLSPSSLPSVSLVMLPADGDMLYARCAAANDIKSRFQRLAQVSAVRVTGGERERVEIRVMREKMAARKLDLAAIAQKISQANYEYPAGTVHDGDRDLLFKTAGLYQSIAEIGETPLFFNEGGLVKVSDIAEVRRASQDKQSFFYYEGEPCVRISIYKKPGESPVALARAVKKETDLLRELYGGRFRFIVIADASAEVVRSVQLLVLAGLVGCAAVFCVIFFTFRSGLLALLLTSVIPLSVPVSIFVLALCGKTLNTLSLAGITIGIGLLVDSGAVVLENMQKSVCLGRRSRSDMEAAASAVLLSNTAAAFTTAAVFVPVLFTGGVLSALFADLALAVISAVCVSCLWSFTYIPALFMFILPRLQSGPPAKAVGSGETGETSAAPDTAGKIGRLYENVLRHFLRKKCGAVFALAGCLAAGTLAFFSLKTEFLPPEKTDALEVVFTFENGVSTAALEQYARELYTQLAADSCFRQVYLSGGVEDDDFESLADPGTKREKITLACRLAKNVDAAAAREKITSLAACSSVPVLFIEDGGLLTGMMQTARRLLVQAENPAAALKAALSLGFEEKLIQPHQFANELVFTPDRTVHARFGVTAFSSAAAARFSLAGAPASSFYEAGREIPVTVRLDERYVQTPEQFGHTGVLVQNGVSMPLRLLGSVENTATEKVLYRYNRRDARLIYASRTAVSTVTPKTAVLPSDVSPTAASPAELVAVTDLYRRDLNEIVSDAGLLFLVVLLLLYLILAAQFESLLVPLLLFFALPPAFAGAFLFLAIGGKSLNLNSVIALVLLFGTAVNNTILLYENCRSKTALTESLLVSRCSAKLRAVLVTTATTIAALLPFAAGFAGSAQASLALAVTGGLAVSSLAVIFAVPLFFGARSGREKRHE